MIKKVKTAGNTFVRLAAALLCAALTLCPVSCGGGSGEETSSGPQTSAEPSTGTAKTPEYETDPPVTETEFVTDPEKPTDFVILCSPEALAAEPAFSADGSSSVIAASKVRDGLLNSEYGVSLVVRASENIEEGVRNSRLSGDGECDVMLITAAQGIRLMHSGLLQDLSETGIGLGAGASGARSALTRDLSIHGCVGLYFCEALVSDIYSTYCLGLTPPETASEEWDNAVSGLIRAVSDGRFTFSVLSETLKKLETVRPGTGTVSTAGIKGRLSLLNSAGGRIFDLNSMGVPSVSIRRPEFRTAYGALSDLCSIEEESYAASVRPVALGNLGGEDSFVPLPKAAEAASYVSFVDLDGCTVFASPDGLVHGARTARLVSLLCRCSAAVRSDAVSDVLSRCGCGESGNTMIDAVLRGQTAECGYWYGWGDLGEYITANAAGTGIDVLLADKELASREKAAAAASAIIDGRVREGR